MAFQYQFNFNYFLIILLHLILPIFPQSPLYFTIPFIILFILYPMFNLIKSLQLYQISIVSSLTKLQFNLRFDPNFTFLDLIIPSEYFLFLYFILLVIHFIKFKHSVNYSMINLNQMKGDHQLFLIILQVISLRISFLNLS